ncbi:MAG TPA: gamma-glutamyltransferase [Gemmatimonadaceae bacterium]
MTYRAPISFAALALSAGMLTAQDSVRAPGPPPVESHNGMVVCASNLACDVGASILKRGGNAVDAMVATGFAMAVTYPFAGNIGGGGFMVVRVNGVATTFDFREKAPLKSTPTMYLDSTGNINRRLTATGYIAPGVPGTVRGLEMAHKKFGKLPWKDVVLPAAKLADGFVLSADLARSLNRELGRARDTARTRQGLSGQYETARGMQPYPASVAAYGKANEAPWMPGDTIHLPALAKSLRAIADGGGDAFYKGWIADSIAADMMRHGGLITKADLAQYRAVERAPIKSDFHGYTIIAMPPPSSGGVAMTEILNILDKLNAGASDRYSPRTLHLMIEATRRAFLDRARFLGDPDFVKMPLEKLTSKAYAAQLAKEIDTTRASKSVALAPDLVKGVADHEHMETTHISIADKDGNAASMTYTLEGGYGSHVVISGTGFLLNNEMGDFNKRPGYTGENGDIGTAPNLIAPGKRMLSSMSPAIVTKGNDLYLVTGSPGGRTIINTVFDVLYNVLQYNMNVRAAVDAPRLHHQWLPDTATFEANAIPAATADALRAMGHAVKVTGSQGDAHSIRWDAATKTAWGANDTRSKDSTVAVPQELLGACERQPAAPFDFWRRGAAR